MATTNTEKKSSNGSTKIKKAKGKVKGKVKGKFDIKKLKKKVGDHQKKFINAREVNVRKKVERNKVERKKVERNKVKVTGEIKDDYSELHVGEIFKLVKQIGHHVTKDKICQIVEEYKKTADNKSKTLKSKTLKSSTSSTSSTSSVKNIKFTYKHENILLSKLKQILEGTRYNPEDFRINSKNLLKTVSILTFLHDHTEGDKVFDFALKEGLYNDDILFNPYLPHLLPEISNDPNLTIESKKQQFKRVYFYINDIRKSLERSLDPSSKQYYVINDKYKIDFPVLSDNICDNMGIPRNQLIIYNDVGSVRCIDLKKLLLSIKLFDDYTIDDETTVSRRFIDYVKVIYDTNGETNGETKGEIKGETKKTNPTSKEFWDTIKDGINLNNPKPSKHECSNCKLLSQGHYKSIKFVNKIPEYVRYCSNKCFEISDFSNK